MRPIPSILFMSLDRCWSVMCAPSGPLFLTHRRARRQPWYGVQFLDNIEQALEYMP